MSKAKHVLAIATVGVLALAGCAAEAPAEEVVESTRLNIYSWAGEVPDSVIAAFEDETGIEVTVDNFDSNETLIAKLAAGGAGYDIVEPTQNAVYALSSQGLLQELDHTLIEGFDNIGEPFKDPAYDLNNTYSIPWVWGTTGLMYNSDCTDGEEITSWSSLFDETYAGKIYMLDSMLSAYIVGLQMNGYDASSTSQSEIETATETLLEQKPLLAGYNASNYVDLVASGEACIAQAWSGPRAAEAVAASDAVHFVVPEEGGTMWVDSLAIPSDAPHADAAYKFINFLLRPEIAAMVTNDAGMASANYAATEFITDEDIANNPVTFPSSESLMNVDFILDPGEALTYFQEGWTRIKAS